MSCLVRLDGDGPAAIEYTMFGAVGWGRPCLKRVISTLRMHAYSLLSIPISLNPTQAVPSFATYAVKLPTNLHENLTTRA